ncbi:MAG: RluA family pseudouridine synthase [Rickettsiales bacterium]|jgi:23S rRNA pseudouridine1911/1915/1917 synthase|nr:RluA family pseudouridine synthase [Rickettsiales bacterium]
MNDEIKKFVVGDLDNGQRLDKFLSAQMPEFSRNEIQKFGIVKIPDKKIKLSDRVKVGDIFAVSLPIKTESNKIIAAKKNEFPLDILYEDNDIIVVNKPRGVAMYPGAGREDDTMVARVLAHTNLSNLSGDMRPGVVHRLDKDTSGIVIFAKSDAAMRTLTATFAAHDLIRKYIAFVWGIPNWETADIFGNIGRSTKNRQKMTMLKVGGKPAQTQVRVVNAWAHFGISKLECTLLTGRTHQIRVHLSSHGFPVVCDPVYGRGTSRLGSVKDLDLLDFIKTHHGQMLHAAVLELHHPITNELLKFRSKLPTDMKELQEILSN